MKRKRRWIEIDKDDGEENTRGLRMRESDNVRVNGRNPKKMNRVKNKDKEPQGRQIWTTNRNK